MSQDIAIWGGVECTLARIGGQMRDQTRETGHHARLDDLDRIAALGIRTLRYPVLWEAVSPERPDQADFSWHDARLDRLERLGIRVIAGLCHHGSGPRYTDMMQPEWPAMLADHARRVAERYPRIWAYTPVNEPLTTARFSGLYGHWHPHARSYSAFLRMLVHECKATVLAMRAIRRIRPDALLVQTEDLGKTFSTPLLRAQAAHENERRWLSFDLLCGRVGPDHGWWPILLDHGVAQADLELLREGEAAPDIIGINHYLTSERWLDEELSRYPAHHWGGNDRLRYADAEAVRMAIPHDDLGPLARLREAWQRYGRPIAVTEVHHGCSRDEQLRWLMEVWNAAGALAREGADIRAVTLWSLFGTVDWNSLLTRQEGCFEPGAFDTRGPRPRPTALARAGQALALKGTFDHPVLDRAGWWRRDERFYPPAPAVRSTGNLVRFPRRLMILGSGPLARAIARICRLRGLDLIAPGAGLTARAGETMAAPRAQGLPGEGDAPWMADRVWAVIDAGAQGDVAGAAFACARAGIPFVSVSEQAVFGGAAGGPWHEDDAVCPPDAAGHARAAREQRIVRAHADALLVRTGPIFGPWDREHALWGALNRLARTGQTWGTPDLISPTYAPDLAHEVLNLVIDGATGFWHLVPTGEIAGDALLAAAARRAGLPPGGIGVEDGPARRLSLASRHGTLLPPLESALDRYLRESEIAFDGAGARRVAE